MTAALDGDGKHAKIGRPLRFARHHYEENFMGAHRSTRNKRVKIKRRIKNERTRLAAEKSAGEKTR